MSPEMKRDAMGQAFAALTSAASRVAVEHRLGDEEIDILICRLLLRAVVLHAKPGHDRAVLDIMITLLKEGLPLARLAVGAEQLWQARPEGNA
jgi:hypothetical protein